MPGEPDSQPKGRAPFSELKCHLVERNYKDIGCDSWNSRKVKLLCAKLNDTPAVMASRMRLRWRDFEVRMRDESWTRQDGLILTTIEREVEIVHAGRIPESSLVAKQPELVATPA